MALDLSALTSDGWLSLVVTSICVILFVAFLWKQFQVKKGSTNTLSLNCQSPNCVRCKQIQNTNHSIIKTLRKRCHQYISTKYKSTTLTPDEFLSLVFPRILSTIQSISQKSDILVSTFEQSGYETDSVISHLPHIWTVPNLQKTQFWDPKTCTHLKEVASKLTNFSVLEKVLEEYNRAKWNKGGWKINTTPNGQWRIYSLYNQGGKVDKNCAYCPETLKLLQSFSNLMQGCIYGNAMFSVLEPNSSIEPHTGPCNFRLRCHMPLIVPPGFKVQIGHKINKWKIGELLFFDDSYVHNVWHEASNGGRLVSEVGARVVLIFDLWHPGLESSEVDLLRHCFSEPFGF